MNLQPCRHVLIWQMIWIWKDASILWCDMMGTQCIFMPKIGSYSVTPFMVYGVITYRSHNFNVVFQLISVLTETPGRRTQPIDIQIKQGKVFFSSSILCAFTISFEFIYETSHACIYVSVSRISENDIICRLCNVRFITWWWYRKVSL